jgi:hypothetical protein
LPAKPHAENLIKTLLNNKKTFQDNITSARQKNPPITTTRNFMDGHCPGTKTNSLSSHNWTLFNKLAQGYNLK